MMPSVEPRILLVITQSDIGGAQRYVVTLARDLAKRGASVTIASGQPGPMIDEAASAGINTLVVPSLVRPIRLPTDLRAIVELTRLIRRGKFDVVHLNSTKAGIVGRIAARLAGVKIVFFTVHGLVLNEPLSRPSFVLYWLLEWAGARLSTRIFASSDADRIALQRLHIARDERVTVIRNGIALTRDSGVPGVVAKRVARAALGIPEHGAVVGTVANLYRTKALDVLIEAAPLVVERHPGVKICIVGEGHERSQLEAKIACLGLNGRVILLGGLTNPREILPAFDLFVLPSRKEGLPFALLEAMDASLPTVATRVGGVPEVITDDCGLLVEKEDPTALAQALLALLENPDLARELGTAARRRIQTKFNEDSMLEQTASVYWSELDRLAPHMMPLLKEGHAYEHDDR